MQDNDKNDRFYFDNEAFRRIVDDNAKKVVAHAYSAAVELAIVAKHGPGIINRAMLPDCDIQAIRRAMAPLIPVLEIESLMSVVRVVNEMLRNPSLRDYLQRRTASTIGKRGGRKPRARAAQTDWLEGVMRQNLARHPQATLTAKEHRQAIIAHPDIQGDVDGKLAFSAAALDRFDADGDVFISDAAIAKMLTHIKKNPL